jgi:hypothetical protein
MGLLKRKLTEEPVAVVTGIQGLLAAVLLLGTAFNVWNMTETQYGAVIGVYVSLMGVVMIFLRGAVTPNATAEANVEEAELKGIAFGVQQAEGDAP